MSRGDNPLINPLVPVYPPAAQSDSKVWGPVKPDPMTKWDVRDLPINWYYFTEIRLKTYKPGTAIAVYFTRKHPLILKTRYMWEL